MFKEVERRIPNCIKNINSDDSDKNIVVELSLSLLMNEILMKTRWPYGGLKKNLNKLALTLR